MERFIESVGLSLNQQCGNCNGPIHVPGLVRRLVCPHCAQPVKAAWKGLERDPVQAAGNRDVSYAFHSASSQSEGRWQARRQRPACSECDSALDLSQLSVDRPSIPCAGGHTVSVRPAEKLARTLMMGACWVIGEGIVVDPGDPTHHDLLVINCTSCGGQLEIEPSKRDITCRYCSSLNVVSDELWVRLHPELRPREFFIVATWTDEEYDVQRALTPLWHDTVPKKRRPQFEDERALCADWPTPLQSGLEWMNVALDTHGRRHIALTKRVPEPVIAHLASDRKVGVRALVAERQHLSETVLRVLITDEHPEVRGRLADREDLPDFAIEALIAHGDERVLDRLERQSSPSVVLRIALAEAGRPTLLRTLTPEDVTGADLPRLAALPDKAMRVLAAQHPDTDETVLASLATDDAIEVRKALAQRYPLPPAVVETLFRDRTKKVRDLVHARRDLTEAQELELAAEDPAWLVRLLERDDSPPEAMELALKSDSDPVRRLLARNPTTPELYLIGLIEIADDPELVRALAVRERTTMLRRALAHAPALALREAVCADELEPELIDLLARDPATDVRKHIAARSDLPSPVALLLANDGSPAVAALVVDHPAVVARRTRMRLAVVAAAAVVLAVLGCAGLVTAASMGLVSAGAGAESIW